ncbi:MAG: hypothetical protein QOH04_2892 [Sphingomonadales bacterium]|jgi:hypothetical protein|nr:hypothetical protein [Sphingomonadales bacterium]
MVVHITVSAASNGPDIWDAAVALGSAVVGAVVGAVPAFVLAKRSSREVLARDRTARLEAQKAGGMRVHIKLGTIVNSMLTLKRQLREATSNPPMEGAELWQCVEPVVGFAGEEHITFDAEEAAVFLAAGKGDYVEALLLLARRHSVEAEVMKEYGVRREQLRRDMPPPAVVEGTKGSTYLNREEFMRVRPQMVGLNTLLTQLLEHLDEDVALGLALARDFGPILRDYFKDPTYPQFVIPEDVNDVMAVRRYGEPSPPGRPQAVSPAPP